MSLRFDKLCLTKAPQKANQSPKIVGLMVANVGLIMTLMRFIN
ncbi:hypothetical protein [Mannheimia sp. ZY171111]|nr:hypothetical protein [Mannheimia sp. ZY171111]